MTKEEWELLRSVLPTVRRGSVRKNDRRIMDGIFFILRAGSPWRDLPERYGPYTTCYNRYNRWSKDGTWARIISDLQRLAGSDGDDEDGGGGSSAARLGERLSPGQAADCTHTPELLASLKVGTRVITDNAYDSDAIQRSTRFIARKVAPQSGIRLPGKGI